MEIGRLTGSRLTHALSSSVVTCSARAAAVILAAGIQSAWPADHNAASMRVEIRIAPIAMLAVAEQWVIVEHTLLGDGRTRIVARTRYGVTCIVPDSTIRGVLTCELPDGVSASLRMLSTVGISADWVELEPHSEVTLVTGPRGSEHNYAELAFLAAAGTELPDLADLSAQILFTVQ